MDLLAAWRGCLDDCFAFFGTRLKERFLEAKVVAVQDVGGHGPKCEAKQTVKRDVSLDLLTHQEISRWTRRSRREVKRSTLY